MTQQLYLLACLLYETDKPIKGGKASKNGFPVSLNKIPHLNNNTNVYVIKVGHFS